MTARMFRAGISLFLLLALAGCTSTPGTTSPSPTASVTPTPSPTPAPTPTPFDPTGQTFNLDPAAWTVSGGWQVAEWELEDGQPSGVRFDSPTDSPTGGWSSLTVYPAGSTDYSPFADDLTAISCAETQTGATVKLTVAKKPRTFTLLPLRDTLFAMPAFGRTLTYNTVSDGFIQITEYCIELGGRIALYQAYELPALTSDPKAPAVPTADWPVAPRIDPLWQTARPAAIPLP